MGLVKCKSCGRIAESISRVEMERLIYEFNLAKRGKAGASYVTGAVFKSCRNCLGSYKQFQEIPHNSSLFKLDKILENI